MSKNQDLNIAKTAKRDEFYTQLSDIDNELRHYRGYFVDKVVYCNCDDPRVSNFFHYFAYNFERLGLKKLITTCYKNQRADLFSRKDSEQAIRLEYTGDRDGNRRPDVEEIGIFPLKGDGDFRSPECIELLQQADIVCTNPPFSLFREYVAQLLEHRKRFVIIGSMNAVTYREVFPLIKDNEIWLGHARGDMEFGVPEHYPPKKHRYRIDEKGRKFYSLGNATWFTNLDIKKRHEDLILYRRYLGNDREYPKYDNYDAIEVSRVANIPQDWEGAMGVPVTFLSKYNPDQFEILGMDSDLIKGFTGQFKSRFYIEGKRLYSRIVIRNRKYSGAQ